MKPRKVRPGILERLQLKRARATDVRLGVAWYTRENWARIRETATDRENLENTYEDWLHMAEESLRTIEGAGANPHKVLIDAEEFLAWCREHNRLNESGTRAEFTSLKMRSLDGHGA